jgi:beta-galactosidase GanA
MLLLAGEIGNSNASSKTTLDAIWPRLVALHLNTVLVPVYWELLEPEEGRFNFDLVLHVLDLARHHQQHLILLWFGAYKNSMSCYVPAWVKTQTTRFPRARLKNGTALEILTPFSEENLNADLRAFVQLMNYLAKHDTDGRVVMVQVENEVGMIPEARDACDQANVAFTENVPEEVMRYLNAQTSSTEGLITRRFREKGCPEAGSWEEVFGVGLATDELFMTYYFARYVDRIAAAGKAVHPLPMYVNAALNRPGKLPGEYPSAGPLPHLFEMWRLAAPHVDFLSPDIYFSDFAQWCEKYRREGPLFIPEATNGSECTAHAIYALGACSAIGFSPFTVEAIDPKDSTFGQAYEVLGILQNQILVHRDRETMGGVLLTKDEPHQVKKIGDYRFRFSHDLTWEWSGPLRHSEVWPKSAALVIATGLDEFIVLGTSVIVTVDLGSEDCSQNTERAGILFIDECYAENGQLLIGRRLNGDESHQGRHLRIPAPEFGVQRLSLYRYR